jgi:lipid-binding SYLF domain-containing protein
MMLKRTHKAAQVFREIMNTPDQGIPQDLLKSAKCIAIIPGDVKFAFVFGGNYGRGLATCRTGHGWSAPMFVAIDGGSVGYQIGGSSTDIVMLFMNDHALQSLLGDKFKLGADASVAAGPVGRTAAAGTDVRLNCGDSVLFAGQRPFRRGGSRRRRGASRQEWRQIYVWRQCGPP